MLLSVAVLPACLLMVAMLPPAQQAAGCGLNVGDKLGTGLLRICLSRTFQVRALNHPLLGTFNQLACICDGSQGV